jgi:DHA1 family tetracycline resistance protein-like MFS transporter
MMSLWGLMNPAVQSLSTQLVAATEQGRLQGVYSSMMGIANMLGPIAFTTLFAVVIDAWRLPGLPFLLSASLLMIASVVAIKALRQRTELAPSVSQPTLDPSTH